jgi:hypothetical protein
MIMIMTGILTMIKIEIINMVFDFDFDPVNNSTSD